MTTKIKAPAPKRARIKKVAILRADALERPVVPLPAPRPIDEDEVYRLLGSSVALHKQCQATEAGRPVQWRRKMKEAYDLRVKALSMDPDRACGAWKDEQALTSVGRDTHAALMTFYVSQLGGAV